MVDAIEKQVIQAKVRGENIEYMRSKHGFSHTIDLSGNYKPLKKLSDTIDYYNENQAPVFKSYDFNKNDYEKVKRLMEIIAPDYDFPRKPIFGSKFELPITLTRANHKAFAQRLKNFEVNI